MKFAQRLNSFFSFGRRLTHPPPPLRPAPARTFMLTRSSSIFLGASQPAPKHLSMPPINSQLHLFRHHLFCTTTANESCEEGAGNKQMISVAFVGKDGEETEIKVPVGMSMLEAAHENDIDLEGACEGSLACSTCHVIVMDVEYYNKLEDPTDEENDMLDLAFGLTETSRLGCQVIAAPELDGLRLALPAATRNFAVDGFKPKPH